MSEPKEIYSHASAFHDIHVTDHGFVRVLSFGPSNQSSMFLDAPFETDFEYPGYFHLALAVKPDAARTLAVGLGGGTVVKRMWRDYPEMRVDAVELDAEVVDVARRFFELPNDERVRVFVDDGRRFLESCPGSYDIVIVDAFEGDAVPPQLSDAGFMRALHERLAPDGAVVYNFVGTPEGDGAEPFRSLQATLAAAWRTVWVFEVNEGISADGGENLILVATDAPLGDDELQARIASRVDGRVTVPAFQLFGEDLRDGGAG
jgi:spermidine synthase